MSSSPFIFSFYLFLVLLPRFNVSVKHNVSVKLKLVHVDSLIASPLRTKYDNDEHRDEFWTKASAKRLVQIHQQLMAIDDEEEEQFSYHSQIWPDQSGVLVANLGVGTPVNKQSLAIDSATHIMWVTCNGSRFQAGDYSYLKSRTASRVDCTGGDCEPFGSGCSLDGQCQFLIKYASVPKPVQGIIVKDKITFWDNAADGLNIMDTWSNAYFGCGYVNCAIHEDFSGTGVMGLSNNQASIVSQFGSTFSYCVGNIYDYKYESNSLILGGGLLIGDSTPILEVKGKNFVTLISIEVDGDVLDIDPSVFERHNDDGGTLIDTGSSKTYLTDNAYLVLLDKMKEKMNATSDALCFTGLHYDIDVPFVQFIFEEGATLTLGIDALFGRRSYRRCFSGIKPSSKAGEQLKNYTLIGINAQQGHNMGYDYDEGRVYMSEEDCSKLPE